VSRGSLTLQDFYSGYAPSYLEELLAAWFGFLFLSQHRFEEVFQLALPNVIGCYNLKTAWRIVIKFDILLFNCNLSTVSNFNQNYIKIAHILFYARVERKALWGKRISFLRHVQKKKHTAYATTIFPYLLEIWWVSFLSLMRQVRYGMKTFLNLFIILFSLLMWTLG
jgi:hypothetical protein